MKENYSADKMISTHAYQNAVSMGTHSSSKPLLGLELNLSVYMTYIEIAITWGRKNKLQRWLRQSYMQIDSIFPHEEKSAVTILA